MTRAEIQKLYIRACRDAGWQLHYIEAAKLVGRVLGIHGCDVYDAFSDLNTMLAVAKGEHPACGRIDV